MKTILLCAGYGTRLYPLTENQPKPLLPVGGRPILEHLLKKIEEIPAVDGVYLVTNDRFYSHFTKWAEGKRYPWRIEVINDGTRTNETRLGAIGDLKCVIQKTRLHDNFSVFAGDNLFLSDLKGFFAFAESHRPHTSVAIIDIQDRKLASQYGIVVTARDGHIKEFFEKPKAPPSTAASTGIYWFAKESLDLLDRYLQEGHNADRLGDYISWLVKTDSVFAYLLEGKWFDIGDIRSYREADQFLSEQTPK